MTGDPSQMEEEGRYHRHFVLPVENLRDQASQSATVFAAIGIRSAYLLNGGALIAIPAIVQIASAVEISKAALIVSVMCFVVGIATAILSNIIAYRVSFAAALAHAQEANARILGLYNGQSIQGQDTYAGRIKSTAKLAAMGLAVLIGSMIAFLLGLMTIIFGL